MADRLFACRFAEAPMPRLSADPIAMTAAHEQVLTRLIRAHTTPRKLAERARMILLAVAGTGVRETARQLEVWPKTVRHWLRRWRTAAEAAPVAQRLADAPRPGAPATFTPEQICAIVALACEQPAEESNLPLSHWSRSELARCAIERGIVDGISNSSVGRFFKRSRTSATSRARLAHAKAGSGVRDEMCRHLRGLPASAPIGGTRHPNGVDR
jgi:putative transposase